jgi:hypothetical protein
MSERITWEACPVCGSTAAVGWGSTPGEEGRAQEDPVEFDCPNGCRLSELDLARAFT